MRSIPFLVWILTLAGFGQGKGFSQPGAIKANAITTADLAGGGGGLSPSTTAITSSVTLDLT